MSAIFRLANGAPKRASWFAIQGGSAECVNLQNGELNRKLLEVFGGLREGDTVAVRGTDEFVRNPSQRSVVDSAAADIREMISAK